VTLETNPVPTPGVAGRGGREAVPSAVAVAAGGGGVSDDMRNEGRDAHRLLSTTYYGAWLCPIPLVSTLDRHIEWKEQFLVPLV